MKRILVWTICAVLATAQTTREAFNTSPPPIRSFFSCSGRPMGYYADLETNCRAYHTCDDHGNHFTHYCPEDTAFRQDAMICDHAYLVDCQANAEKGLPIRFSQDANHDAPPSSFVEPRGEGSNTRGFARSFRINPDTKNDTASGKYPTFVLNSSVFLTSRESTSRRPTTRYQESENDLRTTKSTIQDSKHYQSPTGFRSSVNPSRNSIITTPKTATLPPPARISDELQPPLESKIINDYQDDEYSFLIPPPIRDDNYYAQQNNFESLKSDNAQKSSHSAFRIVTVDDFKKESTTTISPHTRAILEMAKARALGREFSPSNENKPVNYLEPPYFRPDFQSNKNFNVHSIDPYKHTLLALQNLSRSSTLRQTTTTTASRSMGKKSSTEASIFSVPSKTLIPGSDADNDPYYPKSSTTEAYYTPRHYDSSRKPVFSTTTKRSLTSKFEIPATLPDLNSLEDLLDRRKFFFIPQMKSA